MTQAKLTRDSFHVFQANAKNALKQSEQVPSVLICAGTGACRRRNEDYETQSGVKPQPAGLCGAEARQR